MYKRKEEGQKDSQTDLKYWEYCNKNCEMVNCLANGNNRLENDDVGDDALACFFAEFDGHNNKSDNGRNFKNEADIHCVKIESIECNRFLAIWNAKNEKNLMFVCSLSSPVEWDV